MIVNGFHKCSERDQGPITDIGSLALLADEVGISDVSYLGKMFGRRFGKSPAALRREARGG